jgi:hypothetical protein
MERGLMWLPLLGVFIWLARLGSREYRQIQVYQDWAQGFDRHKYDIYAVLGWRDRQLTWGKATPAGVEVAGSFSLDAVVGIELCKNGQAIPVAADSARLKDIAIRFSLLSGEAIDVPFTDGDLACRWLSLLEKEDLANPHGD